MTAFHPARLSVQTSPRDIGIALISFQSLDKQTFDFSPSCFECRGSKDDSRPGKKKSGELYPSEEERRTFTHQEWLLVRIAIL
jgi:hypothetical protein